MPIITVQRRMTPQGNIRIGHKVTGTRRDGSTYTRPEKLDRFRFTSPSKRLIDSIAETYGGEGRPWDNDGKAEFEVITDATAIPVIVVKGGFSQWHEHFTKAGLQHRCDGEKDPAGVYCDPQDPAHKAAIEKPTTRLSVMLSEIETLGVWTLVTKSWNAAAELPSMTELAMHVGDLVPATLGLREKSSVIQTDKGPQTSRFVVPVLDLHVTKQRLVELVGGPDGTPAIEGGARPALAAATGDAQPDAITADDPFGSYYEKLAAAQVLDDLAPIWDEARQAGLVGSTSEATPQRDAFVLAWKARAQELKAAEQPAAPAAGAEPDEDGVVDAELVEDPAVGEVDANVVWQQVLVAGGEQGMSLADVQDDFASKMGGLSAGEASPGELQHYLALLTGTGAAA